MANYFGVPHPLVNVLSSFFSSFNFLHNKGGPQAAAEQLVLGNCLYCFSSLKTMICGATVEGGPKDQDLWFFCLFFWLVERLFPTEVPAYRIPLPMFLVVLH